jgi:hypothetical protein
VVSRNFRHSPHALRSIRRNFQLPVAMDNRRLVPATHGLASDDQPADVYAASPGGCSFVGSDRKATAFESQSRLASPPIAQCRQRSLTPRAMPGPPPPPPNSGSGSTSGRAGFQRATRPRLHAAWERRFEFCSFALHVCIAQGSMPKQVIQ